MFNESFWRQIRYGTCYHTDYSYLWFFFKFQDEKSLVGWLQVRDSKTRARQYIPIVQPAPEGPFRKAPWHGNVHVLKFWARPNISVLRGPLCPPQDSPTGFDNPVVTLLDKKIYFIAQCNSKRQTLIPSEQFSSLLLSGTAWWYWPRAPQSDYLLQSLSKSVFPRLRELAGEMFRRMAKT